jgi:phenylacetate 2-hydroxylase
MESLILLAVFVVLCLIGFRYGNRTDIPKIKSLPELPGVPFFGSLIMLGKHHARNCAKLAKQYGDVFQVRLGNRVSSPEEFVAASHVDKDSESYMQTLLSL